LAETVGAAPPAPPSPDFFAAQDAARARARRFLALFALCVVAVVVAMDAYVALFSAMMLAHDANVHGNPNVLIGDVLPQLPREVLLATTAGTAALILVASIQRRRELARGSETLAQAIGARAVAEKPENPAERQLRNVVEEMALASGGLPLAVYVMAKEHPVTPIEGFGRTLVRHFLGATGHADRARVRIAAHGWDRIAVDGQAHDHSFVRGPAERRMAYVSGTREGERFEAGIEELEVLKTTRSAFEGYIKDRFTTLPETRDRIFATVVSARWKYDREPADFDAAFASVRTAMLETFAQHDSKSVQQTLFAMGAAAIDAVPEVSEILLSLPNRHHLLFDLARFGMQNANEVFVPTTEPYGLIEATVVRE